MLNWIHLPSGAELLSGGIILPVIAAGAGVAALIVLGAIAFRRAGALWGGALVMVGALIAALLLDGPSTGDRGAERRAIETRAAELTIRAIAPGSALACLDAVANFDVEVACEKALFASPEAVAAALAYVDARISLLKASTALAKRDASYDPPFERLRHAIEVDRFGLSAQVLMTRGCNSPGCADLKLLRNTGPILANMKARTFDSHVSMHANTWNPNGATMATASLPPMGAALPPLTAPIPPAVTTGAAHGAAHGGPVPSKFDFPSAASIPAVSIMNAEPAGPPGTESQPEPRPETRANPTPPKRPQNQPRRQSAREAPPLSVVPPAAPPPQTSGTR